MEAGSISLKWLPYLGFHHFHTQYSIMQSLLPVCGSGPISGDQLQEWFQKHSFISTGCFSLYYQVTTKDPWFRLNVGHVQFLTFIFCSGRLIRTLANVQYRNYHLTPVEIVYNIFSFIVAIISTIAFTIYARRTLDELKAAEANGEGSSPDSNSRFEMHKLPLEKYKNSFSSPWFRPIIVNELGSLTRKGI